MIFGIVNVSEINNCITMHALSEKLFNTLGTQN